MVNVRMFLCLMLLVLSPKWSYSQDVLYSSYTKFDYRSDDFAVVGRTGGLVYTYLNTNSGALLDAYDDSMNKVATVLLDFFPSKIYEVRFLAYTDKIIVLYQALESNKVVQYAALLDEKGRLKGKPLEFGHIKTGILGATRTYFSSAVSDDKKSILIYSANDRGGNIEFEGKWLDDKLTVIKKSKATFKTENTVEHGEVNVGNDGKVYMAAYTPVGSQNYADQFWILMLPLGSTTFEPKELELGDRFAASGYMKLDNTGSHVYFGGFYSNRKSGNYDGIIYADYDMALGKYATLKLIPFDAGLLQGNSARNKNRAFDNFQVRQLIVKNDGGFVLVSESQFITTRANYMPGMGYYSFYSPAMSNMVREYHYNDIMALCYDKEGTRQWGTYIPKEQYSQEDGGRFSSYSLLNSGGSLAFLYNDFNAARSRIQLATIDANGKSDMHSFTADGNDNPDWLPRSGKQVSSRALVIPCLLKRQICFAKVEL